ncbi:MAG TPA: thiamine pyrophosphate-binding protein [Burkholderiales bacterium]|nr:thiamine pyrophosphate-binding protein [Burkholderiales bacterium]
MKASDAVARYLATHDITYCFELIGGMITHLLDSLAKDGRIQIISMHHEQAAAFAAEGVVRKNRSDKLSLAMGTSGPGASNLITGIGDCWFDSIPCLFITGQVNTGELKGNIAIRQQGFQELDIVTMVRPITKYAAQVLTSDEILPQLHQAMSVALSGRKGPVLIDMPNNVQRQDIPDNVVEKWLQTPFNVNLERTPVMMQDQQKLLEDLCKKSCRPLFCIGGGARWSDSLEQFLQKLDQYGIPYVSTLMGQERIVSNPHYFHMIGAYGNREANYAVENCDLLIVLGSRLDIRQTGADVEDFARKAKIVQIDIDSAQLNNRVKADLAICTDIHDFMESYSLDAMTFPLQETEWVLELQLFQNRVNTDEYPDWEISPFRLFSCLNEVMHGEAVHYVCDVGNHQMWAAQGLRLEAEQTVHYSGGMGAMGFAVPAAIGVALGALHKTVVITGDGSMQVNLQELDTLVRLGLDISIIVLNNVSLGMVKNFQDIYFDGRDQSTREGYSCPSFSKVAIAYGIPALVVSTHEEFKFALEQLKKQKGPFLIEVLMDYATECRPRLAFGCKLDDQYPKLDLF